MTGDPDGSRGERWMSFGEVVLVAFSSLRWNAMRSLQSFGWETTIKGAAILIAFLFAAGVGVLFGVWPARRAALLDPITALRYE